MEDHIHNALKPDLLNDIPVAIAFQDRNHNIQWANKSFLQAADMSLQELTGKKCFSVLGLSKPCRNCPVGITLETGELAEAQLTVDNQEEWHHIKLGWEVKTTPIQGEDGTIIGAVETFLDLTDRLTQSRRQKKIMPALLRLFEYAITHTTHELLQEFLDEAEALTGSSIGFYHFVENDQVTISLQMWSSSTQKICSVSDPGTHYHIREAGVWVDCVRKRVPVIHNDYDSLPHKKGLPEGHVAIVRDLVVPVLRGGKLVAILGVGNKETHYEERDTIVVEQLAELAWETVVRKRSEEEYKKLQAQYLQAQKMESIGRLAGGVAHDFNNMLSVIIGNTDMALGQLDSTHPLHSFLTEISNATDRSANLTNQLLAFARKQTIAPRILNLNDVVSKMLKMISLLIGEGIDMTWLPSEDPGMVKMDPGQIEQLIANLCVNARDAISGIGKVTIETHQVDLDETYSSEHPEFLPGSYVMLVVSDNGSGMEKEILTKIFEPFFTTKKEGEGTGLGLSTVYGIVKQNNGFINVYSEPGEGTTFKIYLTRYIDEKESTLVEAETFSPQGSYETVLLVEDEMMILNLGKKMLRKLGYKVLVANTPTEALQLANEHTGKIDLILTDVVMPEMNGRDLVRKIETLFPDIKTLYMSGYTADVVANHGILKDGIKFIQKPFMTKELAVKVREAVTQK